VVVSGCSHAGIINTVLYAKKLTGVEKIHAVLGGFHLSGAFFEKILEKTIEMLKALSPAVVVPMHCTGRKAIERFSQEFPSAFVLNSVGSKITLT
jgi:7,8-dihydropterin-6-yl-methyl-4-(beta-D-ribofuranosyl)aminobenzene 5'-phosphate synthase